MRMYRTLVINQDRPYPSRYQDDQQEPAYCRPFSNKISLQHTYVWVGFTSFPTLLSSIKIHKFYLSKKEIHCLEHARIRQWFFCSALSQFIDWFGIQRNFGGSKVSLPFWWAVAGGRWPVGGGRWPVAGGRWPVGGGATICKWDFDLIKHKYSKNGIFV